MKRVAFDHPKIRRLQTLLAVPRYAAIGILESLWHFVAKHSPAGDIGRWGDTEIAEAIDWPITDAARLIESLTEAGWLDANSQYRLLVHDWPDHTDDAVHMALARRCTPFANGSKPKLGRLSMRERERIEPELERACAQRTHTVCTEYALPEPEPEPVPEPVSSRPGRTPDVGDRELAEHLWELVKALQPTRKPPDLNRWANSIRLMREQDGRTHESIRDLFERANRDPFWQTNILSPDKLRQKFDDLQLKLTRPNHATNHKPESPSIVRRESFDNLPTLTSGAATDP